MTKNIGTRTRKERSMLQATLEPHAHLGVDLNTSVALVWEIDKNDVKSILQPELSLEEDALRDYDLGGPAFIGRTGTPPFMAIDLLNEITPPHVYRHELESLFYTLLWSALHYNLVSGVRRPTRPTVNAVQGFEYAERILDAIPPKFESLRREWIEPLYNLISDACESVPRKRFGQGPPKLLAEAESGSLDSLTELCHALEPGTMTIDLVKAALKYLRVDRMPKLKLKPGETLPKNRETQQAVQFCYVFYVATFGCYENQPLLEGIVNEVVPMIDDLCTWIQFLITHKLAVHIARPGVVVRHQQIAWGAHNNLLYHLADMDPRLFDAFIDSDAYMDLLLHLWMDKDEKGGPYVGIRDSRAPCPLLTVLLKTLDDLDGQAILLDTILARRGSFAVRFIASTMGRVRRMATITNDDKSGLTLEKAMQYIEDLVAVLKILLTNHTLQRLLVQSNYLQVFVSAFTQFFLEAWAKYGLSNKIWKQSILHPIFSLSFLFDEDDDPRVIKTLGDMAEGGFPTLIVYALANAYQDQKPEAGTVDMGVSMLEILACHAVYPTISTRVALESIPKTLLSKICTNSRIRDAWTTFVQNVKDGITSYTRFKDSSETTLDECSEAREDYLFYKETTGWYSHSTRAYHVAHIAALYNQLLLDGSLPSAKSSSAAPEPPLAAPCDLVLMNFTVAKMAVSAQQFDVADESDPRRISLFQECLSGSRRLVTAVFPVGYQWDIRLTVALAEAQPGHFYPTCSLFRYD
ncbi:hypothetical protein MD484_g3732, partial [Candolleomyces efflorescens]